LQYNWYYYCSQWVRVGTNTIKQGMQYCFIYYFIIRTLFQRRYGNENNIMVFSGLSIAGTRVLLSVTDSRQQLIIAEQLSRIFDVMFRFRVRQLACYNFILYDC